MTSFFYQSLYWIDSDGISLLSGKGNKGSNGSSTEALDMSLVKGKPPGVSGSTATVDSGSGGGGGVGGAGNGGVGTSSVGNNMASTASTATANGGASTRKKSILKKSDSTIPKGSSLSGKLAVGSSTADPELENLLVSDQESANNTPAGMVTVVKFFSGAVEIQ